MTRMTDLGDRWRQTKAYVRCKGLGHLIGRRGAFLLFLAILDFLFGYSILAAPSPPVAAHAIDLFLPAEAWAAAWMFVGAICLWQAFVKLDRLAFALAATIKITWGTTMLLSWMLTNSDPRGWVTAVIFVSFGILTGIVSYWPEHNSMGLDVSDFRRT